MGKVAIITDSNSGITQKEAAVLGIQVVPMPFYINEELFFEDITLTQEAFYEKLEDDAEISTSQPSPGDLLDLWNETLKTYDEIIYLPMSSALSSSCSTAVMLSEEFDGKVYVVDNKRISVTLKQSVLDAMKLAEEGKSAKEIHDILVKESLEASIYITVDTMKYLKKGGRVTPTAAALGTVLNIKPVLQIHGGKLDTYAKVRGWKAAKKSMLDAIEKDITERFAGKEVSLAAAYTCDEDTALEWKNDIETRFPGMEVEMNKLSLSVSCHIGPGSMAVACIKKIEY